MCRNRRLNDAAQLIEVERVEPDQLVLHLLLNGQRRGVAIAFAEADVTVVAFHFDDRAQCERFMDATGVEQRRIAKGDRGYGHAYDFQRAVSR